MASRRRPAGNQAPQSREAGAGRRPPLRAELQQTASKRRRPSPGTSAERAAADDAWRRYFELFALAPVACARLDSKGVIQELNQAGLALFGADRDSLLHKPLLPLIARADRRVFLDHMRRVRATNVVDRVEISVARVRPAGSSVRIQLTTCPTANASPDAFWSTMVDLTDLDRLDRARVVAEDARDRTERDREELLAANAAKDRFLATLSHELRTPLGAALTAAEGLAKLDYADPAVLRYAEVIERSIAFEVKLIDALLDATRIERGAIHLDLEPVDLHAVIEDTVAAIRNDVDAKHLRLQFDFAARQSVVEADPHRLQQIFANLLSNAVKFSSPGGRIVVATQNDDTGAVVARVTDEGIGLTPEVMATLFRPFEESRARPGGGLGLGLSICRGLVEAHHGRIAASSDGPGRGATFTVSLPTAREAVPVPHAPAHQRDSAPPRLTGRVLLVEDDPDNAVVMQMQLELLGAHVEIASSVETALARLEEPWDAIISDLGLPDGSGLAIARHLRALRRDHPVAIALSGYGTREDTEASMAAGFDAHVVKPVRVEDLVALIGRVRSHDTDTR